MKQVVFAVFLLAMASLTGCLNEEDSSDTTEDNSDTDDGLIDPVGQIPDDSSIFIDNPYESASMGSWECGENLDGDYNCDFVYHGSDHFGITESGNPAYFDADVITTDFFFNGWVNKTGKTVTIENLHFPEGDRYGKVNYVNNTYCDDECWDDYYLDCEEVCDGDECWEECEEIWVTECTEWCWTDEYTEFDYEYVGRPVTDDCNYNQLCEIIFYGHEGLVFNGKFTMSADYRTHSYVEDPDDGNDTHYKLYYYENYTVTFDLPFEPYGFSIIENGIIYRIF